MNKKFIIVMYAVFLVAAGLATIILVIQGNNSVQFQTIERLAEGPEGKLKDITELTQHYSYLSNREFYDQAFARASLTNDAQAKVYGGIVPHHLLPADIIASFYNGLRSQEIDTAVVIGPNHFGVGHGDIIISKAQWQTPYGLIQPDLEVLDSLSETGIAQVNELPFENEHSITSQVSFIKEVWPQARIVPIIVKYGTDLEHATELAEALDSALTRNSIVVASVDFSHNQPAWVADFHDELSRAVIEGFDFERIYDLEIDSPASIYTLLKYLSLRDAHKAQYLAQTSSAYLLDNLNTTENTSYLLEYFTQGEANQEKLTSVLFAPDMMFDRYVKDTAIKNGGYDYLFETLFNLEGQFFRGFDFFIANLEGPITDYRAPNQKSISFRFEPMIVQTLRKYRFNALNLANNHGYDQEQKGYLDTIHELSKLGIGTFGHPTEESFDNVLFVNRGGLRFALVGFNTTDHPTDDSVMVDVISQAARESDLVLVSMHWGVEYQTEPSIRQQELGRKLIDAGADAIFGHHPHVIQSIEVYDNKPIFYSLGNFIFDQFFSKETQTGMMVGVVFSEGLHRYYLFPYTLDKAKPKLMLFDERREFLSSLANRSKVDKTDENQLSLGVIEFKK